MSRLMQPKGEREIAKLGVANVRKAYNELAKDYNRIIDGEIYYCHKCNEFYIANSFYNDNRFTSGLFPICKKCLLALATDYDKYEKEYVDNREKTIKVFQMMDLPFIDSLYQSSLKQVEESLAEKNKSTAYQHMLVQIKSLPQYKKLHWKDSNFGDSIPGQTEEEINENSRIIKVARKRFGKDYTLQDLYFLETQYEDWVSRYACESKAQEILFQRIVFTQLAIDKAQKMGKDTKELDKTLQDLMSSSSIKPNQLNANALVESKTFGQLIQKWEDEYDGGNPIPEPDEDFKDPDKIGLYIDVFFKGHLSKMMGLKNAFSSLYDRFMAKYTVTKPQYDEESDSEELFDQIFGSKLDD